MQPTTITSIGGANPNDAEEEEALSKLELLERKISTEIDLAKEHLEKYTKNDMSYRRKDTVEVVKDAMRRIKDAASEINQQTEDIREKLYYLIYNSTIMIFRCCH